MCQKEICESFTVIFRLLTQNIFSAFLGFELIHGNIQIVRCIFDMKSASKCCSDIH